eukprot:gnl/TRDRNA2_/TRDRNA2_162956_c0_seq3.p1 gnl/TRDRNA2_/TRDRNA2_162956_c0~~gnl/TRDRNA2_/TRDRNA2_162956_c0_seq3.p1  ORF type:complete len:781 (+),score=177.95 gnl/TRDRNA2_/TRDRNA2_162956_c0_seq3:299-2344(+)
MARELEDTSGAKVKDSKDLVIEQLKAEIANLKREQNSPDTGIMHSSFTESADAGASDQSSTSTGNYGEVLSEAAMGLISEGLFCGSAFCITLIVHSLVMPFWPSSQKRKGKSGRAQKAKQLNEEFGWDSTAVRPKQKYYRSAHADYKGDWEPELPPVGEAPPPKTSEAECQLEQPETGSAPASSWEAFRPPPGLEPEKPAQAPVRKPPPPPPPPRAGAAQERKIQPAVESACSEKPAAQSIEEKSVMEEEVDKCADGFFDQDDDFASMMAKALEKHNSGMGAGSLSSSAVWQSTEGQKDEIQKDKTKLSAEAAVFTPASKLSSEAAVFTPMHLGGGPLPVAEPPKSSLRATAEPFQPSDIAGETDESTADKEESGDSLEQEGWHDEHDLDHFYLVEHQEEEKEEEEGDEEDAKEPCQEEQKTNDVETHKDRKKRMKLEAKRRRSEQRKSTSGSSEGSSASRSWQAISVMCCLSLAVFVVQQLFGANNSQDSFRQFMNVGPTAGFVAMDEIVMRNDPNVVPYDSTFPGSKPAKSPKAPTPAKSAEGPRVAWELRRKEDVATLWALHKRAKDLMDRLPEIEDTEPDAVYKAKKIRMQAKALTKTLQEAKDESEYPPPENFVWVFGRWTQALDFVEEQLNNSISGTCPAWTPFVSGKDKAGKKCTVCNLQPTCAVPPDGMKPLN